MFAGGVRDGGAAPFLAEDWNPWEDEQVEYNSALNKKREAFKQHLSRIDKNKPKRYKVQIWGKAAIGTSWCNELYNILSKIELESAVLGLPIDDMIDTLYQYSAVTPFF